MIGNGKTVVIVDDHETLVMYLAVLMSRMGFSVIPARNGQEALKVLSTVSADLVITDRNMPIMDGMVLIRQMKNTPTLSDIPIIMCSAYCDQETLDEILELGAVGLLKKPVKVARLHSLLQDCVTYPNATKRRHLRCPFGKKVSLGIDGQTLELYAVILSEGGIYLRTQKPLETGTTLSVRFEPVEGQSIQVQGEVIYQKTVFNDIYSIDPGMAIRFRDLDDAQQSVLRNAIIEILAGDLKDDSQNPLIDHSAELSPSSVTTPVNETPQPGQRLH